MVLVFSEAANNSDEIKKELSLASKHHLPLMALRIEDVEPSDAFAYELSTRQWITRFESWDARSMSCTAPQADRGRCNPGIGREAFSPGARSPPKASRRMYFAAAAVLVLAVAAGAWWLIWPASAPPHSMMVRLAGFSNLSSDLPTSMPEAMRDEIIAAFNDDGLLEFPTGGCPPPGERPLCARWGRIRRDGEEVKVNVRLTNERSGATLWSNMFTYEADQLPRVPRRIAIDAGNMLRCGLFGASTYRKPLSDTGLSDYSPVLPQLRLCSAGTRKGS